MQACHNQYVNLAQVPKSHLDGQHLHQVVKGKSVRRIRVNHFKVKVIWIQCTALKDSVKFLQYLYPATCFLHKTHNTLKRSVIFMYILSAITFRPYQLCLYTDKCS